MMSLHALLALSGVFFSAFGNCAIVKRTHTCSLPQYMTQNNGEVTSHTGFTLGHHYGKNLDCLWKIEAPAGMHVLLTAESFDLEDSQTCQYDYLVLYDGNSTASQELGRFCGSSFAPISSTGRVLTLEFVTDDGTQLAGFKLHYNFTTLTIAACSSNELACGNGRCVPSNERCDGDDDCGDDTDEQNCVLPTCDANSKFVCANGKCVALGWRCDGDNDCGDNSDESPQTCAVLSAGCGNTNLTGPTGSLTSPNYPNSYTNDLRCVWYIQGPLTAKTMALRFDALFNLEVSDNCRYDHVTVYSDGHTFNHGPFCGDVSPGQFTVPGNHVLVEFTTDNSDTRPGFRLEWRALS